MVKVSAIRREILAGCSTFLTMIYIVLANPIILSQTGMNSKVVFIATCLVTAVGSFLIGWWARYPIAIAPGMALNVYFTYVLVGQFHFSWQVASAIVFFAGIILIVIALLKWDGFLISFIPPFLNTAITAGLGLFLFLMALRNIGIELRPQWYISPHLTHNVVLFLCGFIILLIGQRYRFRSAILMSIVITAILGMLWKMPRYDGIYEFPHVALFGGLPFTPVFSLSGLCAVISVALVTFFDSSATLVGLLNKAGLLDVPDSRKRMRLAYLANGFTTTLGGLLGTASTSTYLESSAGIQAGGRTQITAWTVSALFLVILFFAPLASMIPVVSTAPALLWVGFLMMIHSKEINWLDYKKAIPSAVTLIGILITFSIADGLGAGLFTYILLNISKKTTLFNKRTIFTILILLSYFVLRIVTRH